jgi:hypothetical protein
MNELQNLSICCKKIKNTGTWGCSSVVEHCKKEKKIKNANGNIYILITSYEAKFNSTRSYFNPRQME